VDAFAADPGVSFPAEYQNAITDQIARELSVEFPTVMILRQGDQPSDPRAVLRVSGAVSEFSPGNRTKRILIGFGAGATVVRARIWFTEAATGKTLAKRDLSGIIWTGTGGGDSSAAAGSLARKIAKVCRSLNLVESH
jgi:hypothetical protein